MSKAFTKESDDAATEDLPDLPPLPRGTKNYITPKGAERLRRELSQLLDVDRPKVVETIQWAASNGDRSENGDYIYGKKRLREIDRRLRFLTGRLEMAELVDPSKTKSEVVKFGATVVIRDDEGKTATYSIVGIDETEVGKGKISWISPLARAIFNSRVGDTVILRSPQGEKSLEILSIDYVDIP